MQAPGSSRGIEGKPPRGPLEPHVSRVLRQPRDPVRSNRSHAVPPWPTTHLLLRPAQPHHPLPPMKTDANPSRRCRNLKAALTLGLWVLAATGQADEVVVERVGQWPGWPRGPAYGVAVSGLEAVLASEGYEVFVQSMAVDVHANEFKVGAVHAAAAPAPDQAQQLLFAAAADDTERDRRRSRSTQLFPTGTQNALDRTLPTDARIGRQSKRTNNVIMAQRWQNRPQTSPLYQGKKRHPERFA